MEASDVIINSQHVPDNVHASPDSLKGIQTEMGVRMIVTSSNGLDMRRGSWSPAFTGII